jgi:hypothetical protein
MLVNEITSNEATMAWARSGTKVVRKFRCSAGRLKGKIVASPASCYKAPNIQKRIKLAITKARFARRNVRKANRTKRINPASRRVQALNRAKGSRKFSGKK